MQSSAPKTNSPRRMGPAPEISGKVILAVIPLAVFVTGLVIGQSFLRAVLISGAVTFVLFLLQIKAQRYTKSNFNSPNVPLRDRPIFASITIVFLGLISGGVAGLTALVFGFHGNAPFLWICVVGPVAWACLLAGSDTLYLYILGVFTPIMWIVYWSFIILGTAKLTTSQRVILIVIVHGVFSISYSVLFQ